MWGVVAGMRLLSPLSFYCLFYVRMDLVQSSFGMSQSASGAGSGDTGKEGLFLRKGTCPEQICVKCGHQPVCKHKSGWLL